MEDNNKLTFFHKYIHIFTIFHFDLNVLSKDSNSTKQMIFLI